MPAKKQKSGVCGKVYLVGAGPGDAGLLTLRGAELLREADVVVYDALINETLLELAPQAKRINAGKHPGAVAHGQSAGKITPQDAINRLLESLARKVSKVVRLKGGDPFVFGRGGEECVYLKERGIPFEVVPGVSAGWAVPAYAGIPLTHRSVSSCAVFVTAHEDPLKKQSDVDWDRIALLPATLVCFMSARNLPQMVKALVRAGKSWATPVTVIENGTLPEQKIAEGNLKTIVTKVREAGISAPALTVIGEVNRLRQSIAWFENRTLSGKRVLVTRAQSQAGTLRHALEGCGAEVTELPVIRILPPESWTALDQALRSPVKFDWVLFTSVNAVEAVMKRMQSKKMDVRTFGPLKIGAVGEATAGRLKAFGIFADCVPPSYCTGDLVRELERKKEIRARHFLLPRTEIAPPALKAALEKRGGRVTQVTVYRTVPYGDFRGRQKLEKQLLSGEIDYVTFTSASTVRNFFQIFKKIPVKAIKSRMVTIGPATTAALREAAAALYKEADPHSIEGLVQALQPA